MNINDLSIQERVALRDETAYRLFCEIEMTRLEKRAVRKSIVVWVSLFVVIAVVFVIAITLPSSSEFIPAVAGL